MSYTKRQLLSAAFDELGMADYIFDLAPDQLEMALRRLDSMMAQWNASGLKVGYPLPSSPENSDIEAETDVPDSAHEAIILNLALRIAPSYGKVASQDTRINAKAAYAAAVRAAAFPPEQQMPGGFPMGAGNSAIFSPRPAATAVDAPEESLNFV
jgi:hypothetical protein